MGYLYWLRTTVPSARRKTTRARPACVRDLIWLRIRERDARELLDAREKQEEKRAVHAHIDALARSGLVAVQQHGRARRRARSLRVQPAC